MRVDTPDSLSTSASPFPNFLVRRFPSASLDKQLKRSEQGETRRSQILAAALDLFVEKGFAGTKIADIADAVGMSIGLLFHYFESKEQPYEELVRIGRERALEAMTATPEEPLAYFETVAELILGRAKSDPFVAKMFVFMSQAAYSELVPEETRNYLRRAVFEQSAGLIRAGQAAGTIRDGDPVALSVAFWASIQGICHALALDRDLPCPESGWVVDLLQSKGSGT